MSIKSNTYSYNESFSNISDLVTKALWHFYEENKIKLSLDNIVKKTEEIRERIIHLPKKQIIEMISDFYNENLPIEERYKIIKIADMESYKKIYNK